MTIDMNKVLEAQQTIEETKKELMLFVKQYFESDKPIEALRTEKPRVNRNEKDFNLEIQEGELNVKVEFHCHKYAAGRERWTYIIGCPKLGILPFEPPKDNKLTIQGLIVIPLEDCLEMKIGGEVKNAVVKYAQNMIMQGYPDRDLE